MHPLILLVNQLKIVDDATKINAYLDLQKQLLEFTSLKANDPRLSMYVRKEGDISISINSRRVLSLVCQQKNWRIQLMVNEANLTESRQMKGYLSNLDESFSTRTGVPAWLIRFDLATKPYENSRLIQLWQDSILDYLHTATATPFPKKHNNCLFAATMNIEARQQLLEWIKRGTLIEKELENEAIIKLFNLDKSKDTPSVSDSNLTQNDDKKMPTFPLNQILYGPPGTGKTYHTINKALEIVGFDATDKTRKDLTEEFDRRVKAGQIVFTTFHQSMSYEDFIEGIKPKREGSDEQPTVTYTVESGIFKQICLAASKPNKATDNFEEAYSNFINDLTEKESIELETPSKKKKFDIRVNSNKNCIATPRTPTATQMTITKSMIRSYLLEQKIDDWKPYTIPIAEYMRKNFPIQIKAGEKLGKSYPLSIPMQKLDFETIFKAYSEEMKKRLSSGSIVDLPFNSTGNRWFLKGLDEKGDGLISNRVHEDSEKPSKKSKGHLKLIYQAYPSYVDSKTFIQMVKVKDIEDRLNLPKVAGGLYVWFLHFKEFERVYLQQQFTPEFMTDKVITPSITDNYVLIIDEINRGNVSQIFGELITLIEEDKRLGTDEALEVTLPYSKTQFGVPPNLYIIGTMNTADRSVEALDTALRRRFSFVEMPPQYEGLPQLELEIEGFTLKKILQTINDRIEVLLNKDNLIGHSYFLSVKDARDLKAVFQNKIMPLLQEYFFGDYGKIGMVLGGGFVEKKTADKSIFSNFEYNSGFEDREMFSLKDVVNMEDEDFETAISTLINAKK